MGWRLVFRLGVNLLGCFKVALPPLEGRPGGPGRGMGGEQLGGLPAGHRGGAVEREAGRLSAVLRLGSPTELKQACDKAESNSFTQVRVSRCRASTVTKLPAAAPSQLPRMICEVQRTMCARVFLT